MPMKFFIQTFGCQMNKNDSELIAASLADRGYVPADDVTSADIAVFNTCSVRKHAESRALAVIQNHAAEIKKKGGIVIISGCMAQRLGASLIGERLADIITGPYQSPEMGEIVSRYINDCGGDTFLSLDIEDFSGRINNADSYFSQHRWHSWVTITHGCENNCAYCIVPSVRGKLISMPSSEIIGHIRLLAEKGTTEITLLGQNVNQYGQDSGDIKFSRLLELASGISGIQKINFLTSHPMDFGEDIIKTIADRCNISRSIHLPLQSGSDRVLRSMNRKYDMLRYHQIVDSIRKHLPDHSISTDLIVGFPAEDADDFNKTLQAVRDIKFDESFTYAYSPREGTPAFYKKETIPRIEKMDRLNELIKLQRSISLGKLKERVDMVEEAIIERISKKSGKSVMGKTFLNHPVVIDGSEDDIGKKLKIKINGISGSTLKGVRIA
jgi:tRNA-2-methylthio-N6-dimethylallyladenosine synthase